DVVTPVRRRAYVQPYRSLPSFFKCLYLERCTRLSSSTKLHLLALSAVPPLPSPFLTPHHPGPIAMDQAALEAEIVKICTDHMNRNWRKDNYRAAVTIGTDFFVKFGNHTDLLPEIATQMYIFEHATSDPDAPRIPKVVHHFKSGCTTYLVMEYITLMPTPPDMIARTTAALVWLARVPADNHVIGPLGDGHIRHRFFKDYRAPLRFSSVKALEKYMDKAYTRLSTGGRKTVSRVEICNDRLIFSQSDMDNSNFGVDRDGKTVLMDFAEIGLLPETFVAHTIFSDKRFDPIATALGLSNRFVASINSMCRISANLQMVGNPTLGLDEHGDPKVKDRQR
ncbi:hypothetical protein FRC11_003771, partial [Ceratobasidium sp. 423]